MSMTPRNIVSLPLLIALSAVAVGCASSTCREPTSSSDRAADPTIASASDSASTRTPDNTGAVLVKATEWDATTVDIALSDTASVPVIADDARRTSSAILAALEAVKVPEADRSRSSDRAYIDEYIKQRNAAAGKRADLIRDLYAIDPDHEQIIDLMTKRWQILNRTTQDYDGLLAETRSIMNAAPSRAMDRDDSSASKLAREAAYWNVQGVMGANRNDGERWLEAAEHFTTRYPNDRRASGMILRIAERGFAANPDRQFQLLERVVDAYPDSRAAKRASGKIRQAQGVGKPFQLSFTDAISGDNITMDALSGKVVVIDFWATWCGPCVAEMPHMKELYAQYKDQGVEFIGISLDQPEDKLRAYVKDNDIPWHQYYQGKGWQSEFSSSWGISGIPALFVVDHEGVLYSTKARGKLEDILPELIARRDS